MGTTTASPKNFPPAGKLILEGGMVGFIVTLTGSASYATGGDALGSAEVPLAELKEVWLFNAFSDDGSLYAVWDATNEKLLVFDAFNIEEGAATDISGQTWSAMVIGYGG